MPRQFSNVRPGPKSKRVSFLGDSSVTESDAESFRTADLETEQTDYDLDYTNSNMSPHNSRKKTLGHGSAAAATNIPVQKDKRSSSAGKRPSSSAARTSSRKDPREQSKIKISSSAGKGPSSSATRTSPRNSTPPTSSNKKKPRKQMNPLRRDAIMTKTIIELQGRTDNLVPKAPFGRIIRELLMREASEATRITFTALEALQLSSEIFLTHLFTDAYLCTMHRGRVTLGVHDIRLVRYLRGVTDVGN